MSVKKWVWMKLQRLFRLERQDAELEEELRFHFDHLVEEFRAEGMSEREARAAARREFGHVDRYREEVWNAWRPPAMADLCRSVRQGVRSLLKAPGFAVVTILTLSVGVGAYTAMASLLYTIMLKPLPYEASEYIDRIDRVTVYEEAGELSAADFVDIKREEGSYGEVSAYAAADVSLSEDGEPAVYAKGIRVSEGFFSVLALEPELGSVFDEIAYSGGGSRVALISRRCWQSSFGGREDIVGCETRLDGRSYRIVGVLPETFNDWRHLGWADVVRPLDLSLEEWDDRERRFLNVVGRRRASLSVEEAVSFFQALGQRLAEDYPEVNQGSSLRLATLNSSVVDPGSKGVFAMIIGLSGCVLLIACSSLANLHIARTISRAREFAMRAALGARRLQVLGTLIVEALLLATAGTLGAMAVAYASAKWIRSVTTGESGEFVDMVLDWRVFVWAMVSSVLTAIAFSVAPALFALRIDIGQTLKRGARGATGDRRHGFMQRVLVVAQFALAMVLLAGAALFMRGLESLEERRHGWDADSLVVGNLLLPEYQYESGEAVEQLLEEIRKAVATLPQVESVGFSWSLPYLPWQKSDGVRVDGRPASEIGSEPSVFLNGVSIAYFETVGTRVLAGRKFVTFDGSDSPQVCIINEAMASGIFGDENPIGRRLGFSEDPNKNWLQVVGVVANVTSATPERGAGSYQLYQPLSQAPRWRIQFSVRGESGLADSLIEPVQDALFAVDPNLPVRNLMTGKASLKRAKARAAILRDLLSAFALVGLGLASLGIYGVIARSMALRTSEFSIRQALGARPRDILKLGVWSGVSLAVIGACIGILGALGVSRVLAASNPGIAFENGPVVFASLVTLLLVALAASYFPSLKATRTGLAAALQAE